MDDAGWNTPEALARDFAPAIFRLAYARTGNRADAEDIMQETFLRLLRARPEFADREHAKAWLLRVARAMWCGISPARRSWTTSPR